MKKDIWKLIEENKNLKTNIELIRYKHEIQDNFDIKTTYFNYFRHKINHV